MFCLLFKNCWMRYFVTLNFFLVKVKDHNIKLSFQNPIWSFIYSYEASISQVTFWCFPHRGKVKQNIDTGPEAGGGSDLRAE